MNFGFGNVVDINDDIPEAQRVKVRIDSIYDDIPEEDLPWCPVARSCDSGITFNIGVSNHHLIPGSRVFCIFLDEYYQQPMVLCQVPRIIDTDINKSLEKRTITTKSGHIITIDDGESPFIEIKDSARNSILMDKSGINIKSSDEHKTKMNITIDSANEIDIKSNSDINLKSDNNISIKTNKGLSIESNEISIKAIKNIELIGSSVDTTKSQNFVLPASSISMFTCAPNDTYTGQPNKRSTDGSK